MIVFTLIFSKDMFFNFLFLIPLFIIGGVSCYTDIKYGKIKNKWILLGFVWVIVLYFSLLLYNYFYLSQSENTQYLTGMTINGLIALVVGIFLWWFSLWAAGDAKLFALYAFLIPSGFYSGFYFSYFFSFTLLVNIFSLFLLFMIIKILIFEFKKGYKKIRALREGQKLFSGGLKDNFFSWLIKALNNYLLIIFIFVALRTIFGEIIKFFGGFFQDSSSIFAFLILIVLYRPLFGFITKKKLFKIGISLLGVIYSAYLIFTNQIDFLFSILKIAFVLMVLVSFLRHFLDSYVEKEEIKKIKIQHIEEGMNLSNQTLKELKDKFKNEFSSLSLKKITREQAELIRLLFKEEPEKEIMIYKTLALAPFMFAGAIVTIFTKTSFFTIILDALLKF